MKQPVKNKQFSRKGRETLVATFFVGKPAGIKIHGKTDKDYISMFVQERNGCTDYPPK